MLYISTLAETFDGVSLGICLTEALAKAATHDTDCLGIHLETKVDQIKKGASRSQREIKRLLNLRDKRRSALETTNLSRDQLLEIAYYLRLTRTLEERLVALFRQAKVIGGLYRSLGQEGESVAAAYALDYKQGDVVQPLIRNMGSILVAGAKPVDIIRQYMAKGDSPTRGRELNIHFGHP